MLRLGLTGAIASGKSTIAEMFAAAGVPVFDADRTVHRLYKGRAAPLVEAEFPGVMSGGEVDRTRLSAAVGGNSGALARLEAIVHPLVGEEEEQFVESSRRVGSRIVLIELPLLLEVGADRRMDVVIMALAPDEVRRERALKRPGMDEAKLAILERRKLPQSEARRRAHFLIDTSHGLEPARFAVVGILRALAPVAMRG